MRKVGGLWHWRIGRFGGCFYLARRKAQGASGAPLGASGAPYGRHMWETMACGFLAMGIGAGIMAGISADDSADTVCRYEIETASGDVFVAGSGSTVLAALENARTPAIADWREIRFPCD